MTNPWLKKNPFMSMWLSGANAVVGAAAGKARRAGKAEATRQQNSFAKQVASFWGGGWASAGKPKRRR